MSSGFYMGDYVMAQDGTEGYVILVLKDLANQSHKVYVRDVHRFTNKSFKPEELTRITEPYLAGW